MGTFPFTLNIFIKSADENRLGETWIPSNVLRFETTENLN